MMTPTTDHLRSTLRHLADEHPAPAPADLLSALRAERKARRFRTAVATVAGIAATAVGALAIGLAWPEPSAVAPAGDLLVPEQEWELTDGAPPQVAAGLKLVQTVDLEGAGQSSIVLPESETQRYAVLWCDTGSAIDDPAIQDPTLRLTPSEVTVPCLSSGDTPMSVAPAPLPPARQEGEAVWEGDLPTGSSAILGIYEEASQSGYPYPGWPDPPLEAPTPPADSVVIDLGTAQRPVSDLQGTPPGSAPSLVRTATASLSESSTIQLWAGMPGWMQVWVDGVLITDDDDSSENWQNAHPALREGRFTVFTAGQSVELAVPDGVAAAGQSVEVSVLAPQSLTWQVTVTDAADAGPGRTAVPPTADAGNLPEWFDGMRRTSTWPVPADGNTVELEVPPALRGQTPTWVVVCPDAPGTAPAYQGLATFSSGGERTELGCVLDPAAMQALKIYQHAIRVGEAPVQVSLPATAGTATGQVAAYLPVPFDDFDHEAAQPLPSTVSAQTQFREGPAEVLATLTNADLVEGKASLTLPEGTRDVVVTTTGVGRLQLLVDGESILDDSARNAPQEGEDWWSAWSDQETSRVLATRVETTTNTGDEIQVRVEGYEPGALTLEFLGVRED